MPCSTKKKKGKKPKGYLTFGITPEMETERRAFVRRQAAWARYFAEHAVPFGTLGIPLGIAL